MIRKRKLKGLRNLHAFFGTRQAPRTVIDSVFDNAPLIPAPQPIGFRSCAEWPPGHIYFADRPNTTTDRHDTREQAEAVCEMLQARGLGGERIHFPVKTWVEEILPENKYVYEPLLDNMSAELKSQRQAYCAEIDRSESSFKLHQFLVDNCKEVLIRQIGTVETLLAISRCEMDFKEHFAARFHGQKQLPMIYQSKQERRKQLKNALP